MGDRAPFRLAAVRFDPTRNEISGPGGRVHLQPQVMDFAVFLAQRPGEVVTRDELIEAVWQGYPGADQSLTNAASKLRQAIEEVGGDRKVLETVPKRGYRLAGAVDPVGTSGRSNRRRLATAAVVLGAAVVASIVWIGSSHQAVGEAEGSPRIAVLPFENLGPAEENHLAAGMTEEITTRLASIRDLGVISRTSAMQYAGGGKDVPTIAAELGVDYLLEGTVRWEGVTEGAPGRIRIAAQLIRAEDDTHLWADIYDRPLKDVFDVQSRIAESVAGELRSRLGEMEGVVPSKRAPTEDMAAYGAYLRGQELLRGPVPPSEDVRRAYLAFRRAADLDPGFTEAWAQLSYVQGLQEKWDLVEMGGPEVGAREALDRAIELDAGNPETLIAQGYYLLNTGDKVAEKVDSAIASFLEVLDQRPSDSRALVGLGRALRARGEFRRAMEVAEVALELSPRDPAIIGLAVEAHGALRQWRRAQVLLDRLIELRPERYPPWRRKARMRLQDTGSVAQAREILSRAPSDLIPPKAHAQLDLYAGDFEAVIERARPFIERYGAGQLANHYPTLAAQAAFACQRTGQEELGMKLARGREERFSRMLKDDPDNGLLIVNIAYTDALLGRPERALERTRELVEASGDNVGLRRARMEEMARFATLAGRHDLALDLIEELISVPYGTTPLARHELERAPIWDGLRDRPRFRDLVERAPSGKPWRDDDRPTLRSLIASLKADLQPAA